MTVHSSPNICLPDNLVYTIQTCFHQSLVLQYIGDIGLPYICLPDNIRSSNLYIDINIDIIHG